VQSRIDASIDAVVAALGAAGNALKEALPRIAQGVALDAALAAVPVVGEVRAGRRVVALGKAAASFLSGLFRK
jgi:hypothetical protein